MTEKLNRALAITAAAQMLQKARHETMKTMGVSGLDKEKVIGTMLANTEPLSIEPDRNGHTFAWTADAYIAELLKRALPKYEELYDKLVQKSKTSAAERYDVGSDVYVYALNVEKQQPEKGLFSEYTKYLVLQTQRSNYVVVMQGRNGQGAYEVHVREFWPDILAVLEGTEHSANTHDVADAAERTDLTIKDLATFSHALTYVSDDVGENRWVTRPSLRSFLTGSMIPRDKEAGVGLRYGDARDSGYVLSARAPGLDLSDLTVDAVLSNYASVSYVMKTMGFAVETVLG